MMKINSASTFEKKKPFDLIILVYFSESDDSTSGAITQHLMSETDRKSVLRDRSTIS